MAWHQELVGLWIQPSIQEPLLRAPTFQPAGAHPLVVGGACGLWCVRPADPGWVNHLVLGDPYLHACRCLVEGRHGVFQHLPGSWTGPSGRPAKVLTLKNQWAEVAPTLPVTLMGSRATCTHHLRGPSTHTSSVSLWTMLSACWRQEHPRPTATSLPGKLVKSRYSDITTEFKERQVDTLLEAGFHQEDTYTQVAADCLSEPSGKWSRPGHQAVKPPGPAAQLPTQPWGPQASGTAKPHAPTQHLCDQECRLWPLSPGPEPHQLRKVSKLP